MENNSPNTVVGNERLNGNDSFVRSSHTYLKWILPFIILFAGGISSYYFLSPTPNKRAREAKPPVRQVDVETVETVTATPVITAHGAVEAKRTVDIQSQLRGEVIELSNQWVPGAFVKQGDVLIEVDGRDYMFAIDEAEAQIARQKALYAVEIGRRKAAELELDIYGHTLSAEEELLVLRQPQLDQIKAEIARYESSLNKAKLELERTTITAPFDAQILSMEITNGSLVRENNTLMNLVGTESFWLKVNVPSHQLRHIDIPEQGDAASGQRCPGANVIIRNPVEWGSDDYRDGCVVSLLPDVDSKIKTAVLMIEIDDPLAHRPENKGKPKVLINSLLHAEIETKPFHDVIAIPRQYLQQGKYVWIMNDQKQLEARELSIAFRNEHSVLIDQGLEPGDKIITTAMPGAVEGIAVAEYKEKQSKSEQLPRTPRQQQEIPNIEKSKTAGGNKRKEQNG